MEEVEIMDVTLKIGDKFMFRGCEWTLLKIYNNPSGKLTLGCMIDNRKKSLRVDRIIKDINIKFSNEFYKINQN